MLELGEQGTCYLCKVNWTEMISLFDSNNGSFDHQQGNTIINIELKHYEHIYSDIKFLNSWRHLIIMFSRNSIKL